MALPRVSKCTRRAIICAQQASRMGHGQMLRVTKADGGRARPQAAGTVRPGQGNPGECVIIRSASDGLAGGRPNVLSESPPGEQAIAHRAGDEDCRRSGRDQRPDGSGPSSGTRALRLHLVMIAPGTRSLPHFHHGRGTSVYLVSGEAEVWHGDGLARRALLRAGDFIYVPSGAPHLTVNRGDATSIAVVTRTGPGGQPADDADNGDVTVELPRHLAALRDVPVSGAA